MCLSWNNFNLETDFFLASCRRIDNEICGQGPRVSSLLKFRSDTPIDLVPTFASFISPVFQLCRSKPFETQG